MDESFSRIIPSHRVGNDGFNWWIGQVEISAADEENNKGGLRYKVAIIGEHPADKTLLDTSQLPWANVMMPVTHPFTPGAIGGAHPQLVNGCWVMGFYLDNDKNKPIIIGSIGQTPGATSNIQDCVPNDKTRFKTCVKTDEVFAPIVESDGEEGGIDGTQRQVVISDGTKDGNGNERVDLGTRKEEDVKREEFCVQPASEGDCDDLKKDFNYILGNFLKDVQNSNGNVGTYYTSKITGSVNDTVNVGRRYVHKAIAVIQKFLAKVKGYITAQIQKAVDKLVKALLRPDKNGNALTPVTEFFNRLIKDLGCKMADLGDRLAAWLTNLLMSYINQIYRAAVCQVDELVNGIISKILQLMNELLDSILGPLQDILGAIAAPLNMIGNAINYILNLLGISCDGPEDQCADDKVCTSGEKGDEDNQDFLDKLLESIDNLFGDTPADFTQYVCDEAYTGNPLAVTTVGFTGGVPQIGTGTNAPKLVYTINDIQVTEGETAVFTVIRSGSIDIASSVQFKILSGQGSATVGQDFLNADGILGFSPNETSKTIEIQTLVDFDSDSNETFFVRISNNSPENSLPIKFKKDIGKCTIIEKDIKEPYDPYKPDPVDPFDPIPDIPDNADDEDDDGTGDGNTTPTFSVIANRSSVPEGEFVIYTVTTTNVESGSILYYTLSGVGITPSDIIGNRLTGEFIIDSNTAKITVGIADDSTVEDVETLTFSINGTDASVDVLITVDDVDVGDGGVGDSPETVFEDFKLPKVNTGDIITDENGGIIEIPIDNPGGAWAEAPYVFIGGNGTGATGVGLLDGEGFLTEIRIHSSGFGYKKNLAKDKNVRCIIDSFTILKTGSGYTSPPDLYVNGQLGIAEAILDVDNGVVIGARVLNRQITFEKFPSISIVGGGGYGARMLPSLACLDTNALVTIGATKIGTGKYVDCP
tara:strand:+ start:49 stop:2838 length:2790 start_codon:yes stop_codon:yes gene_type:complete